MTDPAPPADPDISVDAAPLRGGVFLLMAVYALSYLDRQIVNILAEPIKRDLHLSDKQLGLLIGLSFALFYTGFGLPLARLAERVNRVRLIAICLIAWSVFTALCGLAISFAMLLIVRIGVGVGEAGCLPSSQALIADYAPAERKASSMALLIAGSPVGILLGMAMGGLMTDTLGWRAAFLAAALPGLPLAAILTWVRKDPKRGADRVMIAPPAFGLAIRALLANRSYLLMVTAAALGAFASYAQAGFLASFLLRSHKLGLAAVAGNHPAGFVGVTLGLIWGLGGLFGTIGGGRLADHIGTGVRGEMTISAISVCLLAPAMVMALSVDSLWMALALLVPCAIANAGWAGPFYSAVVSTMAPTVRATAAALALIIVNLVGLGAGPLIVGTLSDMFGATYGVGDGLRLALIATTPICFLSALLFWAAGRAVQRGKSK